jgi:hypothetical protein
MLLLTIGCLVVVCFGGMWLASRPPIQSLFPADTSDIHMGANGWWEWTLSYQTPDPPFDWYVTIVHQLEEEGWMENGEQYIGGPPHNPATYTRMTSFGFVVLWERVELDGDMHGAHLRIYRWMAIQRLKLVLALASALLFDRCVASTRRF